MTNEEAIKILEKMKARMIPLGPLLEGKSKDEEAVDMAIDALSKHCVSSEQADDVPDIHVGKTDGDTISRQMAIDALDCINGTEEVLRSLPSAQPERKTDENNHYKTGYDQGFVDACKMYEKKQPEPKTGHWRKIHRKAFRCSECNRLSEFCTDFCPNCGSPMLKDGEA